MCTHLLPWEHQIATPIDRRMLEPSKKRYPRPEIKKKLQRNGRRGTIPVKSNPIPARWVIHRLENNNTKDVLALFWRFWIPTPCFSVWRYDKGIGNPQGIWPWGPARFDYRPFRGLRLTETPVLEGTNKILHAKWPRGDEQWHHRRLSQNYMLVLGGRQRRRGSAESPLGQGALEGPPWHKASWSSPLTLP